MKYKTYKKLLMNVVDIYKIYNITTDIRNKLKSTLKSISKKLLTILIKPYKIYNITTLNNEN